MSKWKEVTHGIPQGLVLKPALFKVFVNNMDSGIQCSLGKFANGMELCGVVIRLEGRDGIGRNLDRFERLRKTGFELLVLPSLVSPQEESAVYCMSKNPVMD
ncbi:hypothetical protein DUI87_10449 [Hirundo rustica rustica]|uniref:Reverse transcriptase domain-containing protein n=1 Tax=Hirundo rustica rustica TaxID=333673 RepID=A0A3M0KI67_HIRRU|nr:hypothetical protein DUI87_10449 [Hirundo rustica rustica]